MEGPSAGSVRAPDPDRFTLQFLDQGRLSVLADCNRCNGSYTSDAASLSISGLACTRAFCQTSPFDTDYVTALSGESTVAIAGPVLRLSSARGTLRFSR